jgi:hypothetical protein
MSKLKLFMLLLGSKAPNRIVEQHDFFFGIGSTLPALVPSIKSFWPEAGSSIHLDGWREISRVGEYHINVVLKEQLIQPSAHKLFFINLGGYRSGLLEEQHYTVLSVHHDRIAAMKAAKQTVFYKENSLKGTAASHIDEKYGIDVDDIYRIEDILTAEQKERYHILIEHEHGPGPQDEIHLGYFPLNKIK